MRKTIRQLTFLGFVVFSACGSPNSTIHPPYRPIVASPSPTSLATTTPTQSSQLLGNGNRTHLVGASRTVDTFYYPQPSPLPLVETQAQVDTVTTTGTLADPFNDVGAIDEHTDQVEQGGLVTTSRSSDAWYRLIGASGSQSVALLAEMATRNSGAAGSTPSSVSIHYESPQVIQHVPGVTGDTWSNSPAATIDEVDSGLHAHRVYAADGSYVERQEFPDKSLALLQVNADGTGSYESQIPVLIGKVGGIPIVGYRMQVTDTPADSSAGIPLVSISYIAEFNTDPSAPLGISVGYIPTRLLSDWNWKQPAYQETDTQGALAPLDSRCQEKTSLTVAVVPTKRTISRVDSVLGYIETSTEITSVAPGIGIVCDEYDDTITSYYDYSGDITDYFDPIFSPHPVRITATTSTLVADEAGTKNARARAVAPPRIVAASLGRARWTETFRLDRIRRLHHLIITHRKLNWGGSRP